MQMDRGDSPQSSDAKIMSITLVVAEKKASKVQNYENTLVFFMNRELQGVQY